MSTRETGQSSEGDHRKTGKRPIKFDMVNIDAPDNPYAAVTLSSLAYKTQAEIESELVEYGYREPRVWFVRTPLAFAFVTEWDDVLAVAFKGSSTWREWLNNANVRMKPTPYGMIHAGFYRSIMQIGPPILNIIKPGLLSGSKVVVTGHSRGGALAILFAFFLGLNGFRTAGIYMFGAPKVGDTKFANLWRTESEKYTEKGKWIPSFLLYPLTFVLFPITLISTFIYLVGTFIRFYLKRMAKRCVALFRKSHQSN